jgi:hypothetical protein
MRNFFLAFLLVSSCHPVPVVPAPFDASDSGMDAGGGGDADASLSSMDDAGESGAALDPCALACLNLQKPSVMCKAAFSVPGGESCATTCRHVQQTRLMPLDIVCAQRAPNLAVAKSCKGWGC